MNSLNPLKFLFVAMNPLLSPFRIKMSVIKHKYYINTFEFWSSIRKSFDQGEIPYTIAAIRIIIIMIKLDHEESK